MSCCYIFGVNNVRFLWIKLPNFISNKIHLDTGLNTPITFDTKALLPSQVEINASLYNTTQNVYDDSSFQESIQQATEALITHAAPVALMKPIDVVAFSKVFSGKGQNAENLPLSNIFPNAEQLNLFGGTLGPDLPDMITSSFDSGDYISAYTLNTLASLATDKITSLLEKELSENRKKTLAYSPGYCGWNISGQFALFNALQPDVIGLTLNEEGMMQPTKSVSGVLVTGDDDIHLFKPGYDFCEYCRDHNCIPRMRGLNSR